MRNRPLRVVALALALAAGNDAGAERVVIVSAPAGLEEALETALAGWPIQVTSASGDPGATMPAAGEKAKAIGHAEAAGAVIWTASDGSGHAVWVLDVESGRVTTRALARPPPWDEPTAAAVALTIKTLLRHSRVVPVLERYGVEEARAALRAEAPPTAPPAPRERAFSVRLATLAGARIRPTEAGDVELRLGAGVELAPALLGGRAAAVLRIRSGTGVGLDEPDYAGRYLDLTTSLGAAARILAWRRLALVPSAGASLHFTSIDGSIPSQGARGSAARINPSVDGSLAIELEVGELLRVSVTGEVSYALRRQVYLVGGDPVLTLPRLESEIGAALSVPVY
ncbi:MAG TPA: hypothetical protein VFU21_04090 [Kofleriaceae bacterium]|nr:hypothetical protein [Kofleriaceae bacterium]